MLFFYSHWYCRTSYYGTVSFGVVVVFNIKHFHVFRFHNFGSFKVMMSTDEEFSICNKNLIAKVSVCDGMLKVNSTFWTDSTMKNDNFRIFTTVRFYKKIHI